MLRLPETNGNGLSNPAEQEQQDEEDLELLDSRERSTVVVDSWVSPDLSLVDPHSLEGFECSMCCAEISNHYMHCVGCEVPGLVRVLNSVPSSLRLSLLLCSIILLVTWCWLR